MGEKSIGENVVKCMGGKDGLKSMGENFEESMGENIAKSMSEKRWVKKVWMKNSVKSMGENVVKVWMKMDI